MDENTTRTFDQAAVQLGARLAALVVYHGGRTRVVPLRPGQPLLVGRGESCDLQIEDETISRSHTRVEMIGDEIWVEDLRSKNGTAVNGQRVQRSRVTPNDRVAIGAATAFVHLARPVLEAVAGVEAHELLLGSMETLMQRARQGRHKLTLLLLEAGPSVDPEAWFARLAGQTRSFDRLAAYSTRTAELLLWDVDQAAAESFLRRVMSDPELGTDVRAGGAVFPDVASSVEALLEAAQQAARQASPDRPVVWAVGETRLHPGRGQLLVLSAAMKQVYDTASHLARTAIPVLLVGETGTGKELVARHIHESGDRRDRPLVPANCAAIPQNLIESELFGHERGAFTGADRRQKGLFEEAHQGTLFLDEIGELSLAAQAALLRVLESRRFSRVGSAREIEVDVRLVAATHRDLEAMCQQGSFRWDLFFRINTVTLKIPPLRERAEEIGKLAEHFLAEACAGQGRPPLRIPPEVAALLQQYPWPGNVRELRNAMERGAALAAGPDLELSQLPERVLQLGGSRAPAPVSPAAPRAAASAPAELPAPVLDLLLGPRGVADGEFRGFVLRVETALIDEALRRTGGNKAAAARELRMPLRTLKERVRAGDEPAFGAPELLQAVELVAPAREQLEFKRRLRRFEQALIRWALQSSSGSRTAAAQKLRIPERTLRDKLRGED